MTNKTGILLSRSILVWIVSILFYNAVECLMIVDWFWDIYHNCTYCRYTNMNMKVAFVSYPVIAYIVCSIDKIDSKVLYYSILSVLCIVYSSIVVYFNISLFPIKTWIVLAVFIISIILIICTKRLLCTAKCRIDKIFKIRPYHVIITYLVIFATIGTALCHAFML